MVNSNDIGQYLEASSSLLAKLLYPVMAAVVAIHVSTFWRQHLAATRQICQTMLTAATTLWAAGRRAVAACTAASDQDAHSTSFKVYKRLHMLHCQRFGQYAFHYATMLCAIEVIMLYSVWFEVGWNRDFRVDSATVLCHVFVGVAAACPWVITHESIMLFYSANMLILIWVFAGTESTHERFDLVKDLSSVARMLLSVTCTNMPLKIFWNSAMLCVMTYSVAFSPSSCAVIAPGEFAVREVISVTMHLFLALWWERFMVRDCESYINSHSAAEEHVAFNALLNATYDVVVKLDVDMMIEEGGPKLACLLMHQRRTHLDNTDFRNLLPKDDDKKRLTLSVSRPVSETHAAACCLHVQMRDSIGNLVSFELFHASLVDLDEQPRHLIGIREASSRSMARELPQLEPEAVAPPPCLHSPDDFFQQEFSITLDAWEMTVIEATPAFRHLFGPAKEKVTDWVLSAGLWVWFQKEVHNISEIIDDTTTDPIRVTRKDVKMKAATCGPPGCELTATVSITFRISEDSDSDDVDDNDGDNDGCGRVMDRVIAQTIDRTCSGDDDSGPPLMIATILLTDLVAAHAEPRLPETVSARRVTQSGSNRSRSSGSRSSGISTAGRLMQCIKEQ